MSSPFRPSPLSKTLFPPRKPTPAEEKKQFDEAAEFRARQIEAAVYIHEQKAWLIEMLSMMKPKKPRTRLEALRETIMEEMDEMDEPTDGVDEVRRMRRLEMEVNRAMVLAARRLAGGSGGGPLLGI
jgi:hypothetical protein